MILWWIEYLKRQGQTSFACNSQNQIGLMWTLARESDFYLDLKLSKQPKLFKNVNGMVRVGPL